MANEDGIGSMLLLLGLLIRFNFGGSVKRTRISFGRILELRMYFSKELEPLQIDVS